MKAAISTVFTASLLVLVFSASAFSLPTVVIQTQPISLEVDSTADLNAVYLDSDSVVIDTSFTWTVIPDSLGCIDTLRVFKALAPGEGWIVASVDNLSDSVVVSITRPDSEDYFEQPCLRIAPDDTILTVGDQVQFTAWKCDTSGVCVEVPATWTLEGTAIGTITPEGLLDVTSTGYALVVATSEIGSGSSLIIAENSTDPSDDNTIEITRDSQNKKGFKHVKTLTEGEAWTISGLPHPLNVLNGGRIYFPHGCIHEDIRLRISLPGILDEDESDSLRYRHGIVNGLDIQVFVEDTLSEPYVFDDPLFVGLIFKRGLLNQMGIDPTTLSLSYAEVVEDTLTFDLSGIANTLVDSSRNRVFSNVAHFTTLVIRGEQGVVTSVGEKTAQPRSFTLSAAYPNPFNPTTSVSVTLPQSADLQVRVMDILGREVAVLHQGVMPPGSHRLHFDGSSSASGIYFIVARTASGRQLVRKVVLLK